MPDFRPGTRSYHSSRPCHFVNPRPHQDASMRLRTHGPVLPMEPGRRGLLARLLGRR